MSATDSSLDRIGGCRMPHCLNIADGWLEGEALCLGHIELTIERWEAIALAPSLRETLPALADQWQPS